MHFFPRHGNFRQKLDQFASYQKIDITVDTHVRIKQQYAHILKFNMQVTQFKIYTFLFTMNESKNKMTPSNKSPSIGKAGLV